MGKRALTITKDYLIAAPLPAQTETYTVIAHEFVINKTLELLGLKGFDVNHELYRCNEGAQIAQGVYHLNYTKDPDMGLMFAWSNSYDKTQKFRCAIGGYVFLSNNRIISNNNTNWARKHTGTADQETVDTIQEQIDGAEVMFKQLVYDKNCMKEIIVPETLRAELMGRIYFINELLTVEQLTLVKEQFRRPTYDYGVDKDSLWAMYNAILFSLQKANPRTWMDQQRLLHWFLTDNFNIMPQVFTQAEQEILNGTEPVDHDLPKGVQLRLFNEEEKVILVEVPAEKTIPVEAVEEEITSPFTSDGNINIEDMTPGEVRHSKPYNDQGLILCNTVICTDAPVVNLTVSGSEEDVPQSEEAAHLIDEISTEIGPDLETLIELKTEAEGLIDEMTWNCVKCGELQGPDAVFYPGQLCNKCYEPDDTTGV